MSFAARARRFLMGDGARIAENATPSNQNRKEPSKMATQTALSPLSAGDSLATRGDTFSTILLISINQWFPTY
jgi:hypothetical protein